MLALGRKVRQHIKKQRHYFANKGPSSQSYGFSSSHVWMWAWTIKKAEHWKIYAFALWCRRKLLSVPWTARRSNQSILKEISSEYSLEGLMLKLKLQYFGHLMQRTVLFEKTLMLGKTEGKRRRGWQRMRWLDSITGSMHMSLSKLGVGDGQGALACCSPWGCKVSDTTERLNWNGLEIIKEPWRSMKVEKSKWKLTKSFMGTKTVLIPMSVIELRKYFSNNLFLIES